jgi:hypothetical protein
MTSPDELVYVTKDRDFDGEEERYQTMTHPVVHHCPVDQMPEGCSSHVPQAASIVEVFIVSSLPLPQEG